jgi:hypothetical protein
MKLTVHFVNGSKQEIGNVGASRLGVGTDNVWSFRPLEIEHPWQDRDRLYINMDNVLYIQEEFSE